MENYKLNLKKIDQDKVKVKGTSFCITDKETGKVYLTSKKYMDKLFYFAGYKNVNVISVLEEYADKTVSSIGMHGDKELYVDDITDTFIVTSPESVKWVNNLLEFLKDNGFEVLSSNKYDTTYYWDQVVVKAPTGSVFALYIDLLDESVYVMSISFEDNKDNYKILTGLIYEGEYKFSEDGSLTSLVTLITNPVTASAGFTLDQKVSVYEYISVLVKLGYAKKKRKYYYLTEDGSVSQNVYGNFESVIELANSSSWLQQRITEVPGITFYHLCTLITEAVSTGSKFFWDFKEEYSNNYNETSDFFALNF